MLVCGSPTGMTFFLAIDESTAPLAQSAERKALNLVVVGSSPTVGVLRKHVSFLFAPLAEQKIHLARIELATFSVLG